MVPDPCSSLFARLRSPDLGLGLGLTLGPSGRGSVNIDFSSGTLPTGVTLTRASSAYYFNALGVMVAAVNNVARFTYDPTTLAFQGLWIEAAATNVLLQSSTIPSPTWVDASAGITTITQGYAAAPDGTTTAVRLQGNNANTWWFSGYRPVSAASQTYTSSLWIKANSGAPTLSMKLLFNGATTYSQNISPDGTLRRLTFSKLFAAGDTQTLAVALNHGNGNDITAWGYQLELGSVATSYIPTTVGAATRAADVCSFTIPAGVSALRYTFGDLSTQIVSVTPGLYQVPTNLARPWILRIDSL